MSTRWLALAVVLGVLGCNSAAVGTSVTQVRPGPGAARGIDISCGQTDGDQCAHPVAGRVMDFNAVRASGIDFVIVKLSQSGYRDPKAWYNYPQSRAAGLIRGSYHFWDPNESAATQASTFLAVLGSVPTDDLPPALDMEDTAISNYPAAFANMLEWLQIVERATGRRPMVYTFSSYFSAFRAHGVDLTPLARYPLWTACPTDSSSPCSGAPVPSPWSNMVIWQNLWFEHVPGIAWNIVDGDLFNGNVSDLRAFIAGTFVPGGGGPADPCLTASDGVYCGQSRADGFAGGTSNALYWCSGGSTSRSQVCPSGCAIEPSPNPDRCNASGPPASDPCAAAADGVYCGQSTADGFATATPDTLYYCSGGRTTQATACTAGCTIRPSPNPDACNAPATTDPCAGALDGVYCGQSTADGFSNGTTNTLYSCSGGHTTNATVCSAGCTIRPSPNPDGCTAATSDPCAGAADGVYCGQSRADGFSGGATNTLYWCTGRVTVRTQGCSGACTIQPSPNPDVCASTDPCASAADGVYCGQSRADGFSGGATNTLYWCTGRVTVRTQGCSGACTIQPSPNPDVCASADPCASAADGVYCGQSRADGFSGGTSNTLYWCTGRATVRTQVCQGACAIEPSPNPDVCLNPCASAADGVYCGQSTADGFGNGIANTLYWCTGRVIVETQGCASGCTIEPSPNPDRCN